MTVEPDIRHLPAATDDADIQAYEPPAEVLAQTFDTSFEVALDDEPMPGPPVMVDPPDLAPTTRPIIPAHLRTVEGVKRTAKLSAQRTGHRLGYHALRSPWYVLLGLFWSIVGVGRIIGRQARWAWHPELSELVQHAANQHDLKEGGKLAAQQGKARRARGLAVLVALVTLAVAVTLLLTVATLLIQLAVLLILLPVLAHYGRPADKPIVSAAVVTPRFRRLTADVVLRAYYSAGLGHPEKPGQQITFGSQMARDNLNAGSQVIVDLPHGNTFSQAMNARERLASGLDVALSQVYLTRDKSSNRRHQLWVADVDPLSISAGRTPLLDCRPRDIWRPAPLGLDERGRRVNLPLMWTSILVGAQPRKGKTFCARSLALFAALDPYARLSIFDGKGSPDWRKFALVAFTYGFGLLRDNIQGEPVENLRATLRQAKTEVQERNVRLSEMPTSVCPEGKLTREIARDKRYGMPVWLIVLDEFQEFLNTGDEEADKEIAELLVYLVKVGPSAGIIVLSSTQRPSGIGSGGKVQKLFTDYRDNHQTRFALKTGSWQVSDLVLGSGAYSEGYDSSALPVGDGTNGTFDYRGIGILYDSPIGNATVRSYLADGRDAEKILTAARKLRERSGLLEGMAAGQQVVQQARDVLGDVLDSFYSEETFLSWQTLADRLGEQLAEVYADITPDALSATLRGLKLGIESKSGAERGGGSARPKGVYLTNLERALDRRNGDRK